MTSQLDSQLQQALNLRRVNGSLRRLTLAPTGAVDFSSNDFLSLSASPLLRRTFMDELAGTQDSSVPTPVATPMPLGPGGSRLLDGNSAYTERLEAELAAFLHGEAGLLFNSGFDANAGFFACVPQPGDAIVYDALVHASVHQGMRLSRLPTGRCRPFAHNDPQALERVLRRLCAEDAEDAERVDAEQAEPAGDAKTRAADPTQPQPRRPAANVFVAVEALYSMNGDLAPLCEILGACDRVFATGAGGGGGSSTTGNRYYLIVDEAHSTGIVGDRGRGLVCALGLQHRVFARLHTFGKALAANGGLSVPWPFPAIPMASVCGG